MKKYIHLLCLATVLSTISCKQENKTDKTVVEVVSKKDSLTERRTVDTSKNLINEAIRAHGGKRYDEAFYGFTFRKKQYTFKNTKGNYTYTVKSIKGKDTIEDILENGKLTRIVNGAKTELSPKDIAKHTEALNSVVYFATLPYKLKDKAVNTAYEGQIEIKGNTYDMVYVTFDQEGGGEDHDDEFLYWINSETKTMDYLAYNYETNDGGVRFRSAYNPRTVDGMRFQDYVNYEAAIGTPLKDLPLLFKKGQLKELSRIKTTAVVNLMK